MDIRINSPGSGQKGGGNAALGMGCLLLFSLPFIAVGLFTMVNGVRLLLKGMMIPGATMTGFGLVFAGAGFGVAWLGIRSKQNADAEAAKRAMAPDSPWLWREDWAAQKVQAAAGGGQYLWGFAALWNGIAWTAMLAGAPKLWREQNPAGFFLLLFPLVGIGLIAAAIYLSRRARKFGRASFQLETLPYQLGRPLLGRLSVPRGEAMTAPVLVRLKNINRYTTGSGKNQNTHEDILWEDELTIGPESFASGYNGLEIAVEFQLPAEGSSSTDNLSGDRILWRLEASSEVPGVNFGANFELPVFGSAPGAAQTGSAPVPGGKWRIAGGALGNAAVPLHPREQPPARLSLRVSDEGGAFTIRFPAAQFPGAAFGISLITLIFCGAAALLWWKGVWPVAVIFSLVDLLLIYFSLDQWLGVARVSAWPGEIRWARGWLICGREKRMAAGDITRLQGGIGMTSGSTSYYNLALITRAGKKITIGRLMRRKEELDWIATRIGQVAGIEIGE